MTQGILENLIEKIDQTNDRIDRIEGKIDRIWEIVTNLKTAPLPSPSASVDPQLLLFEDDTLNEEDTQLEARGDVPAEEPDLRDNDATGMEETLAEPDEFLDKADTSNIPDWQDKEAFREFTADLIVELRNSGMTLKQIAEELNEMGLKTRSGKDKWSFGMINSILQQVGDNT